MKVLKVGAFTCAMLFVVSSAQALSISKDFTLPVPAAGVLAPTSTMGDVRLNFVGNDLSAPAPNSRSPWDTTIYEATGAYNSVSGGAMARYDFGGPQSTFKLMWGSPDDYNTLEFFLGSSLVGTVLGTDVDDPPPAGGGFVNVTISDLSFDAVKFSSTTDAFEYAMVEAVPVPAALPLMASALGLFGFAGWRRKQ